MRLFRFGLIFLAALAASRGGAPVFAATPPEMQAALPVGGDAAAAAVMPPHAAWAKCGGCVQRIEWERSIGGYQLVMLSALRGSREQVAARDPPAGRVAILRQRFELRRGGQIMLDIEDRWLDPALDAALRLPPPGTDVAGTGAPQVVLLGWSGDGKCCFTLHVIELGTEPRILARVATREGVPRLVQRDADPDFEIIAEDSTYVDWPLMSEAAMPRVVLKYDPQAGQYRFSAADMHRPPPPITRLEAEAKLLHEGEGRASADHVPAHLVRTMLQLIYAGHYPMARRFLDDAWSDSYGIERSVFLGELMQCRLPRSPYWVDIAAMNGLTPVAPRADCPATAAN